MKVIGRTKVVTQHLLKKSFSLKVYSEWLLRPVLPSVSCWSLCLLLYGPFCHSGLKPELSALFATYLSSNISLIYIHNHNRVLIIQRLAQ